MDESEPTKSFRHYARVWLGGLSIGLRTLLREPILGLKRLILPVSYWRLAEFAYVYKQLQMPDGARVLDLGSPKDLAVLLARSRGFEVVATDILREAVILSQRYARAQGVAGEGPARVRSEVQDGRELSYPSATFDGAYSVSVLEHIPESGDTLALQELLRVVKPGSRVVITVPYDLEYRETLVDRTVYDRSPVNSEPVFYERHYDESAIDNRLRRNVQASTQDVEIWGEGPVRIERILERLDGGRGAFVSPLEPLLSIIFLRRLHPPKHGHPMALFMTFQRPDHRRSL